MKEFNWQQCGNEIRKIKRLQIVAGNFRWDNKKLNAGSQTNSTITGYSEDEVKGVVQLHNMPKINQNKIWEGIMKLKSKGSNP